MEGQWTYPAKKAHFLTKTWNSFSGYIPFIISDLVTAIKEKGGMNTEGIFRVKDENKRIDERYYSLDDGKYRRFTEDDNPVLLSCVLKKVIQTMSSIDPIFSNQTVADVLKLVEDRSKSEADIISAIKKLVCQIEPQRRNTLSYLMTFFYEITTHGSTLMDIQNMAICLGVCFVPKSPPELIVKLSTFLAPFIQYADQIYEKDWYSEDKILTDDQVDLQFRPIIEYYDLQIESERRQYRIQSKIPIDYEYNDRILGLQYPK